MIEACDDKQFFMEISPHGPKLKEKHAYFYQCQGTMNIVGLTWMDFVVFTENDLLVERIFCNIKLWKEKMLPKLTNFYTDFLLKSII